MVEGEADQANKAHAEFLRSEGRGTFLAFGIRDLVHMARTWHRSCPRLFHTALYFVIKICERAVRYGCQGASDPLFRTTPGFLPPPVAHPVLQL